MSTQKRDTISRKKIHATIANLFPQTLNPNDNKQNMRTISQLFSGYVHGSSIHLIEMIDNNSLLHSLHGMPNTYRHKEFIDHYWHYSYNGLITMMMVSAVFGFIEINSDCIKFRDYFEKTSGATGRGDINKLLREMKKTNK